MDGIYEGGLMRFSFEGKSLYHAKDCKLSISTKMEEIATKDTEGTVSTPSSYSYTASTNCLVADVPVGSTTKSSWFDLAAMQLAKTPIDFVFSDGVAGGKNFSGTLWIESADISATVDQAVEGNFSFKGNGNLVIGTNP